MTNPDVTKKLSDFFTGTDERMYSKDDIITFANQDPEGVLFLVEGLVEQYDVTPEGNKITVNIFKPPAFFPMSWAINKTPNLYFYAALSNVKVKRAHPDKVAKFLQENPDVMFDLLSRVYKGTDGLLRRLVLAASGIASSRLIYELLLEAYRFGYGVDGATKKIKIRQSSLAARSGLARETVSRELHKMEREGLIELTKPGMLLYIKKLEARLDLNI